MNRLEVNRYKLILEVLRKYVRGDHHAKKYTPEHREADKELIKKIENKLKLSNNQNAES